MTEGGVGPDPLQSLLQSGNLEPYIRHIRFPHFKNLVKMMQIDFDYPITALVGANGTSKTSILRALQGCPDYTNIGQYWFSTKLDEIQNVRHQFVHGYQSAGYGKIVESIKARIVAKGAKSAGKEIDPDYFEPSRPLKSAGMTVKMPPDDVYPIASPDRVETRWKAIDKRVLYLDFRAELSAFDKYFHHGPASNDASSQQKKDRVRQWSARLARSFNELSKSDVYFSKQRIIEGPIVGDSDTLKWVSRILGRSIVGIIFIRHNYFHPPGMDSAGWTVRMRTSNLQYSEAFAGSGEFSVAMTVFKILAAEPRTLILLDEPEVSLHPKSQHGLLEFLRHQVKTKNHQIVFATHSPEMIRTLPAKAIKVLALDPTQDEVFLTARETHPIDAFIRLGVRPPAGVRVIVEDSLARAIVERAIRPLSSEARARISIDILGGAAGILHHIIPMLSKSEETNTIVLLDGDQRRRSIPKPDQIAVDQHEEVVRVICDGNPQLLMDAGSDKAANAKLRAQVYADVLTWMEQFLTYLPVSGNPERLLAEMVGDHLDDHGDLAKNNRAAKLHWVSETGLALGFNPEDRVTSTDILVVQQTKLALVPFDSAHLTDIRESVEHFLRRHDESKLNV